MSLDVLFWMLMIIWLIFGFWVDNQPTPAPFLRGSRHFLLFVLFGILGWRVFGPAIK